MIGTELNGCYRILEKLGEGAMAEVYLAEHMDLRRKEALKILHPRLATTAEFVTRFRREARATNRLQHPNIVCVYNFGQLPDGRFYLTTEYSEGDTLNTVLKAVGSFPVPRALNVLAQLADAVGHAHSRGVIHRDLKPENMILVEHRGRTDVLKVLDFGIAKIIAPDYQDSLPVTRQGAVYGTPAYMAPEQFHGEGADPRIDIYAFGCIAFELIVGEIPFRGEPMEMMHAHVTEPAPRPSERQPSRRIPAELDDLVLRCLEKDPTQRFQTGAQVLEAIKRVPGYSNEKAGSGRRSYRLIPTAQLEAAGHTTLLGGFDAGATRKHAEITIPDNAEAAQAAADAAEAAVEVTLRSLAEALIDAGCSDFQLIIGMGSINDLDTELEQIISQLDDLEAHSDSVEQRQREREASLRFAVGELRFERDRVLQKNGTIDDSVERQIEELEGRLRETVEDADQQLTVLTERAIALVALRATKDENRTQLYLTLERLINELAPRQPDDRVIAVLFQQLRAANEAFEIARQRPD